MQINKQRSEALVFIQCVMGGGGREGGRERERERERERGRER